MELIIVFIFGLAIGSFLLVLIDRLPKEKPVFISRSVCDFCQHVLSPRDLIPVISFILQKGQCRYCHKKLSLKYPAMELLMGFSFVVLYSLTVNSVISFPVLFGSGFLLFVFLAVIFSTLVVIFFTDFFNGVIPVYVVLTGVIVTILYLFFSDYSVLPVHFLSAVITMIFFLTIFLATDKKGIGFGDVIYGFYMGLILGFPFIIVGLYIAFLTGAMVSIILVLSKRKKLRGDSVPFGPFLVFGTVVALIFGDQLWLLARNYLGI